MIESAAAHAREREAVSPQCPVCAGPGTRFSFARNGVSVFSCQSCGLEFQFPQPSDERLAAIYSSEYFLGSKDRRSLENQQELKRATARLYLNVLARFMRTTNPRLLEIGCGHGDFLIEAQLRGFDVEGLEYSEHAAAEANTRLGRAAVRVGSPEENCLPLSNYDVIGAFDVIEHLRDPKQALAYMRMALKPEGIIAIVTPSLDSWSRSLLGRYWMEYKAEHLTYFSRRALMSVFDEAGFADIRFISNYKTLNLEYVAAHFERFPVPIATPIVRMLKRILPSRLVHKPVDVVASGVMAVARKRG
jgi:SAM-dependent methyltransferase